MNITPEDLDVVGEVCPWVYGTTTRGGNSGRGTARGVLHGIRASVEHVYGSPDQSGRRVLVQGAGSVGQGLVRDLVAEGAEVLVADVDEDRANATGGQVVASEEALTTKCDVYTPCAVGGTLSAETIPSIINAGGVLQLVGLEDRGAGRKTSSSKGSQGSGRRYAASSGTPRTGTSLLRKRPSGSLRRASRRSATKRSREADQKSWFSPPKIADTESSAKTFMIVSASSCATGRTVMFGGMSSGLIGTVSVTTIPSIGALWNFSSAPPQKTPCVAKTWTALTSFSRSASTFAINVLPVMITSSPTTA